MECGKSRWIVINVAGFQKTKTGRSLSALQVSANGQACRALRSTLAPLSAGQVTWTCAISGTLMGRNSIGHCILKKRNPPHLFAPSGRSGIHFPLSDCLNWEFVRCGCLGDEAKCEPTFNLANHQLDARPQSTRSPSFLLCLTEHGNHTTGFDASLPAHQPLWGR
jgi:hypothetical protein